jgi:hypothetical protein
MAESRTLDDRARSAIIREWAGENGFDLAVSGRIPKGVVAAYEAANGTELPPDDGPDWSVPGDVADPLAGLEGELGDSAGAAEPGEGPPPPADLDEARARLGGKAKRPGWAKEAKPGKDKPPPVKVTRAVAGDIEGKLTLLLTGPAVMWQMADPLCGGTFAENLDNVVRKAVPLICQSPDAVRWFTKGTQFLLWLDLIWALQPIGQAVYAHHVAGSVMVLPDGRVVPSRRLDDGRVVPAEQAPGPPDRSAYTTDPVGHVPDVHAAAP